MATWFNEVGLIRIWSVSQEIIQYIYNSKSSPFLYTSCCFLRNPDNASMFLKPQKISLVFMVTFNILGIKMLAIKTFGPIQHIYRGIYNHHFKMILYLGTSSTENNFRYIKDPRNITEVS